MNRARNSPPLLSADAPRVALLLAAFGLRALQIGRESLWRDEVDSIRFALAPLETVLANFGRMGENGPLYHLVLRGWLGWAGTSDLALRYFSTLCGVVLVAAVYALGRRLLGRRAAGWAAILATASPALVWYAGEGKMYAFQPLLIALALLAAVRGRWLFFGLAGLAAVYTHVLSPLFLPAGAALAWAVAPRALGRRFYWRAAVIAIVVCLPLAISLGPVWLRGADFGHSPAGLDVIVSRALELGAFGVSRPADLSLPEALADVFGLAMLGLAALGVALRPGRISLALVAWMALPVALLALVSARVPLFEPRYMLASAPAMYLLIGAALAALRPSAARAAAAATVLAILTVGLAAQAAAPIRPDLRGAAAWVARRATPGDVVVYVLPYARFSFDHYLPGLDRLDVEGAYTNAGVEDVALALALFPASNRAGQIWLVETEAWMWDVAGRNRAWLEEHATRGDSIVLHGVSVIGFSSRGLAPRVFLPLAR